MACRDGCLNTQYSSPAGGLSVRQTRLEIYNIRSLQPRISLATASGIQYSSVRTSVWSIVCAMRREESVRDLCETFLLDQGHGRNFENHDFHGLWLVGGHFWLKIDVFAVLRTMF